MTIFKNDNSPKHRILLRKSASKDLDKLPDKLYKKNLRAIRRLESEYHPRGSKKIHIEKDLFRLRIGDYRILYKTDPAENQVTICRIVHRKEAYQ